jgi:hypothetical protein
MQSPARARTAILLAATLIFGSLLVSSYIAWLRLKPEVSAVSWIADKADYESHVVNIHHRALARVQPGSADALLPIYDVRNPGLFLLVAELFVRAGATTPVPLQIASMVLFNVGALCFFFWVYVLFGDLVTATFATVFLALSRFFLFFSGVTHTMPFEFVFFNVTMLFFVLFLKRNRPVYLASSLVAMFLTCMNYWFYYLSSWIIMVGLWWQYRGRPRIRDIAIISAPPVAAASVTTIMVMSLFGGVASGTMRLVEIFVARTIDARVPGGHWLPDERFMFSQDWRTYPTLVMRRLEEAYTIDVKWFAIAAGCTFLLLWFRKKTSVVSALILLAGGFSWYYVMFQHTHIHHFAGQYSFMAICPIFGLIVSETARFARGALQRGSAYGPALFDVFKERSGTKDYERLADLKRARLHIAAAAVVVVAISLMILPYLKKTYGLINETAALSRTVEVKYQEAVRKICQQHSEVTVADLKLASKDWGFEWRPESIADTDRMPKCSH